MPDRPLVRRRTAVAGALGGLAGAVLAGGCDVDDLRPPEDETAPTPSSEPGRPSADELLVERVLADLVAAVDLVASARAFRPLRRPLGPLARAHAAHVEVLGGEGDVGTLAQTPGSPPAALRAVRRSEERLQRRLVDAAVAAESGALASLLASMSASVGQHLAVLPAAVPSAQPAGAR